MITVLGVRGENALFNPDYLPLPEGILHLIPDVLLEPSDEETLCGFHTHSALKVVAVSLKLFSKYPWRVKSFGSFLN